MAESALPEPSPICPYPGLKPYDVDDADSFFGRDADIAACLHKLADTRVLAVVGPVRLRQVLAGAGRCRRRVARATASGSS